MALEIRNLILRGKEAKVIQETAVTQGRNGVLVVEGKEK